MEDEVILVDKSDVETGRMGKLEAHQKGLLHRAFSIFIFNSKNEMLLQQRALTKYHSGGLWSNACCSHPRPGEDTREAAQRRLWEEMGLIADLRFKSSFIYRTQFDNQLIEHEFDHVYVGNSDHDPELNAAEAAAYKWLGLEVIKEEVTKHPQEFTYWFKLALSELF